MSGGGPFDLLREEMESDQVENRINAISRLKVVATVMEEDHVHKKLLPYLIGKKKKKTHFVDLGGENFF